MSDVTSVSDDIINLTVERDRLIIKNDRLSRELQEAKAKISSLIQAGLENAEDIRADGNRSKDWLVGYRMALEGLRMALGESV